MKFCALVLALLASLPLASAQDLQPATEISPDLFVNLPRVINPGLTLYGLKWYSSPGEVVAAFGPPHGKILYDRDTFGLLYGQSHVLVFEKNELREVVISSHIFEDGVRKPLAHPFFDGPGHTVAPGYWLLPTDNDLGVLLGAEGFDTVQVLQQINTGQQVFRYANKFASIELNLLGFAERRDGPRKIHIRQISIRGH